MIRRLKYFVVLLFLIFVVFMAASGWRALGPKPPADQTLSILTYNIGNYGFPTPKTEQVADIIRWNVVPDINVIFVQDASWNVKMKDLAESLGFTYFISGRKMSPLSHLGILSNIPLHNPDTIIFPSKSQRPGALCAKIHISDKTVLLCTVHLESMSRIIRKNKGHSLPRLMFNELFRNTSRSQSIDKLLTWIETKQYDAIIVGGDFNTFLFSKTIRAMTARFEDALWPSPDYFYGTYTRFDFPIKPRIDYIFHSPDVKCLEAEIIPITAGDHYPIRAVFDLS